MCAGSLPDSWGGPESFPAMSLLLLGDNALTGTLPASWGGNMSWSRLTRLELGASTLGFSHLSSTLPTAWGSPQAFPELSTLLIANTDLTGKYQARSYAQTHMQLIYIKAFCVPTNGQYICLTLVQRW